MSSNASARPARSVAIVGGGIAGLCAGIRAQLAEEREQWQAVDTTLRGLWRASIPAAAGRRASDAPLPQGS